MDYSDNTFVWSDNWWIEDNKAWFVDGMQNILFCLDLDTHICEKAIRIPDENPSTFRLTPICIKCGKDIYCLPSFGEHIWIYNLDCSQFTRISIDGINKFQWWFDYWVFGNKIFAVARLTNKLVEISISDKKIEDYYEICQTDSIIASIKRENNIYSLSGQSDRIYQYNLLTQNVIQYDVPHIGKELATICFDGKKFWLSGYEKEIYVWDKEENVLTILNDFPKNFGVYKYGENSGNILDCEIEKFEDSTFLYSVEVGEYIWFIPYTTNEIIYVDKQTYNLMALEIDEEVETKESIETWQKRSLSHKYLLEYVRENRYLGLFSTKNERMLEIDAKKLEYQWHDYYFSKKCLRVCAEIKHNFYYEGKVLDRKTYKAIFEEDNSNIFNICKNNIGTKIYGKLMESLSE